MCDCTSLLFQNDNISSDLLSQAMSEIGVSLSDLRALSTEQYFKLIQSPGCQDLLYTPYTPRWPPSVAFWAASNGSVTEPYFWWETLSPWRPSRVSIFTRWNLVFLSSQRICGHVFDVTTRWRFFSRQRNLSDSFTGHKLFNLCCVICS